MKPDAERGVLPGIEGRFSGCQPPGHQACAGDDPLLVRFYDAPVNPGALTKVVGIDDQVPFSGHRLQPKILD
jgi:hypothetical protein